MSLRQWEAAPRLQPAEEFSQLYILLFTRARADAKLLSRRERNLRRFFFAAKLSLNAVFCRRPVSPARNRAAVNIAHALNAKYRLVVHIHTHKRVQLIHLCVAGLAGLVLISAQKRAEYGARRCSRFLPATPGPRFCLQK